MNFDMDSDWDINGNEIVIDTFDRLLLDDSMQKARKRKASENSWTPDTKNHRPEGEQSTFDSIITGS